MRLIDADEPKKEWTIANPEPYNTDAIEVFASIMEAPTIDAVPVVRCKGYKYLMFSDFYGECSKGYMGIVSPDDYCSKGGDQKVRMAKVDEVL